ncbi:inner membrane protein YfeZ [Klebsiella pneumoniae subsp. rhinoscleromatis]|nr:inner membrane protein YfeZ [Klebsiella pneumoniae subsp. rhinoscleromatis]
MKNTEFIPADFDAQWPSAPAFAFLVRAVVAGPHVGAVFDGRRIAQQGDAILNLFYPDHERFWLGLLPGVPAVLAFLLSGYRQRLPRLWRAMRWLLVLSQVLLLLWQADAMAERRISLLVDHCACWSRMAMPCGGC